MPISLKTPGVYITQVDPFPNSIVPVETAIPAFVGYTPRASYNGKSYVGKPVKIASFAQYLAFFGATDATGQPASAHDQYAPVYFPVVAKNPGAADLTIGGVAYELRPDPTSIYYLYNSVQLFYANGGGTCYVVSVGTYGPVAGTPQPAGAPLVNPNVSLASLLSGLAKLVDEGEPTMIVVPEATLLGAADNQTLNQAVLAQCGAMQSRVALFDLPGANHPDPLTWQNGVTNFRTAIGLNNLSYGVAYYPFLQTTVVSDAAVDFRTLGGAKVLAAILPGAATDPVKNLLAQIGQPPGASGMTSAQIEAALRQASSVYLQLHQIVLAKINVLPPSGAMAGVYTMVDGADGVWQAPANVAITAATGVTLKISDAMQAGLNVDAATGKSINALRLFPGRGVIVWGARTLDGNSQDWRYVNVRRTLIFIEQSMKLAMHAYVFEPNTTSTWAMISGVLNNFLTNLWGDGALAGSTAASAFSVAIGLGTTMTAQDILDGILNVSVKVAVSHPAEFIVITIRQRMQTS